MKLRKIRAAQQIAHSEWECEGGRGEGEGGSWEDGGEMSMGCVFSYSCRLPSPRIESI